MTVFCFAGSRICRLTSSGRDTGAAPTREAHLGVLVKDRDVRDLDIAGIRKSGRQTAGLDETAISPFRLLLPAIPGRMMPWIVVHGPLRIPNLQGTSPLHTQSRDLAALA